MICPKCGKHLADGSKYCYVCGTIMQIDQSSSQRHQQQYSAQHHSNGNHNQQYRAQNYNQQPSYQQPGYQQPNYQQNYQQYNYQQNYQQPVYNQQQYNQGYQNNAYQSNQGYYAQPQASGFRNNWFFTKFLPLFANPVFIVLAGLISVTSFIAIFDSGTALETLGSFGRIPNDWEVLLGMIQFLNISAHLLLIGSLAMLVISATAKVPALSNVALILLSVSCFIATTVYGITLALILYFYSEFNIFEYMHRFNSDLRTVLILLPTQIGILIAVQARIATSALSARSTINSPNKRFKPGIAVPILLIIASVFLIAIAGITETADYQLFLNISRYGLITAFFFIMKAKTSN